MLIHGSQLGPADAEEIFESLVPSDSNLRLKFCLGVRVVGYDGTRADVRTQRATQNVHCVFRTRFSQANIKRSALFVMPRSFAPANCQLCHKTQNSASEWAARLVFEKYPLNTAKEELVLFLYDDNDNFDSKDNVAIEN
jgi:hypothetical protein